MPRYPNYPSQPRDGALPRMHEVGPSDLRYSSGTAPHYAQLIDQRYGRNLAGSDVEVQDEGSEQGWAINELNLMAEQDDVQGAGVFDPPGTKGNIHPDAGVFSGRYGIPGYLARERMYAESEVKDVTTGRPVVYVNGGAVAMDDAAQVAFLERGAYAPPQPILNNVDGQGMGFRSTVNVMQSPLPIGYFGADDAPWSAGKMLLVTGLAGLAAGALWRALR